MHPFLYFILKNPELFLPLISVGRKTNQSEWNDSYIRRNLHLVQTPLKNPDDGEDLCAEILCYRKLKKVDVKVM